MGTGVLLYHAMSFQPGAACIITQITVGAAMRVFVYSISILLILAGGVFFLQGINLLPGSFMTGDPQWAINGALLSAVGLGLLYWANRRT
jgi:hypothetical protein